MVTTFLLHCVLKHVIELPKIFKSSYFDSSLLVSLYRFCFSRYLCPGPKIIFTNRDMSVILTQHIQ